MKPICALVPVLLLAACGLARPPADPAAAGEHFRRGQALVETREYPAAVEEFALAQALDPAAALPALAHGDLRQALDQPRQAREAWQDALDRLPPSSLRREIAWRLALLEIEHFSDPAAARRLAGELRPDGFRALDLEGVLLLAQDDPQGALRRFGQALPLAHDPAQAAFARYHAALAHRRLGDDRETFANLFEAINQATAPGLIRDIEGFFRKIQVR